MGGMTSIPAREKISRSNMVKDLTRSQGVANLNWSLMQTEFRSLSATNPAGSMSEVSLRTDRG